jgi:hypothetical protein
MACDDPLGAHYSVYEYETKNGTSATETQRLREKYRVFSNILKPLHGEEKIPK